MPRFLFRLCGAFAALAASSRAATLTYSITTATVSATGCTIPALVNTFLPTDREVVVFFAVSGAAANDRPKVEFVDPQGNVVRTFNMAALSGTGSYCFKVPLAIPGNLTASGLYSAKGYWNDAALFTVPFWILGPSLTPEQKAFDFEVIASLYAKRYAPYDWKKQLFNYDALNLAPWLQRIAATQDDLDYLDILVQYVAALNDTHSNYRINSDFYADLKIRVDAYYDETGSDYSVLIDSVDRAYLSSSSFPFLPGDELLSVDGVPVKEMIEQFRKYVSAACRDAALHTASSYIPYRQQSIFAKAYQLPATAEVEIRRQSGAVEKYTLPWRTYGTALTRVGGAPMVKTSSVRAAEAGTVDETPSYMRTLMRFRDEKVEPSPEIAGYGALSPIWALPSAFTQRLGRTGDYYFTGIFAVNGFNIGYLRIPNFTPSSISNALRQLDGEIQFFKDNTDGLVVDVMRNNGGDPCYGESVLSRLMASDWHAMGRQIRPIWEDIADFQSDVYTARLTNAPAADIALLQARLNDVTAAYHGNRALTGAVSTCEENLDRTPAKVSYQKPILLLTDELSTSAADGFSAQFQDNRRGKLFGWRTNGAGGGVLNQIAGFYSESGTARVVVSMHFRPNPIATPDYPESNYVENVGVRPDIPMRYITIDNMRQNGKPFVDAFLEAISAEIKRGKQ